LPYQYLLAQQCFKRVQHNCIIGKSIRTPMASKEVN
jgi:hypothetical protein